jgi:hypothetical protein
VAWLPQRAFVREGSELTSQVLRVGGGLLGHVEDAELATTG